MRVERLLIKIFISAFVLMVFLEFTKPFFDKQADILNRAGVTEFTGETLTGADLINPFRMQDVCQKLIAAPMEMLTDKLNY